MIYVMAMRHGLLRVMVAARNSLSSHFNETSTHIQVFKRLVFKAGMKSGVY